MYSKIYCSKRNEILWIKQHQRRSPIGNEKEAEDVVYTKGQVTSKMIKINTLFRLMLSFNCTEW